MKTRTCPCCFRWKTTTRKPSRATKAAIFRERTIQRARPAQNVSDPKEALLLTLNERGTVDLDHLSALLHRPPTEFLPELKGAVFLNPQTNRWETEDDYLSGNVRAKLAVAEASALADPQFQFNVETLKAVQPTNLTATEVDARLGSTWIPTDDIKRFTEELLGERGIQVSYAPTIGSWVVKGGWTCEDQRGQYGRMGNRPAQRSRFVGRCAQSPHTHSLRP